MIIHCPSCSARYPVDAASFAPSGRKVRCAKCGHSWHQSPPAEGAPETTPPPSAEEELSTATITPIRKKVFGEKSVAPDGTPKKDKPASGEGDAAASDDEPKSEAAPARTGFTADIGNRFRAEVRRAASMRRGRVLSAAGWTFLILFLGVTLGGGWVYRDKVAAFWPATTKLYAAAGEEINLRGLEFRNVTYERQEEGGLPVLAVMGEVVNVEGEEVPLPRLRVGLRDETQKELYHWTFALSERSLPANQSAPFITRLSSPPPEARDIEVRFVEKTDMAAMESPEAQPETVPETEATPETPADPEAELEIEPEDAPADVPDAPAAE